MSKEAKSDKTLPERNELREVIKRFDGTSVAVIGDLFIDHYVWGKVNRISPEAPVVVVNVTSEDKRLGGAGNVARNLASLGAKVSMCGIIGDDETGKTLINLLEEIGADAEGVMVDRNRSSIIKSRVIAHSQQVVRIDHETLKPLSDVFAQGLSSAFKSKCAAAKGVVVSDYGKGTIGANILNEILAQKSIPVLIDPKSPNFLLYKGATVIKPNRAEAQEASGVIVNDRASAIRAGQVLLERWATEMVLITLGEQGMVLVSASDGGKNPIEIDTEAQDVFDVSGAGDIVSAVFLLSLAVGANAREAALLANFAAGIVVAEVGTVAITQKQLLDRLA